MPTAAIGPLMELYLVKFLPPNLIRRYQKLLTYPDSMGAFVLYLALRFSKKTMGRRKAEKKERWGERAIYNYMYL